MVTMTVRPHSRCRRVAGFAEVDLARAESEICFHSDRDTTRFRFLAYDQHNWRCRYSAAEPDV